MATFLTLCQDVARESGTVATIGSPQTTANQTGREQRIVAWTRDAWLDVQRARRDWRWMRAEFEGATIANVQPYNAAAMGITERFGGWQLFDERGANVFSIHDPAMDRSDEGPLAIIGWDAMRRDAMMGGSVDQRGKPIYMAINDANELVFYPTPDKAYTVRGRYRKAPQTLSADSDIPEAPEEFHDIIRWRALMNMGLFDEAMDQNPGFAAAYSDLLDQLVFAQTPRVQASWPLA